MTPDEIDAAMRRDAWTCPECREHFVVESLTRQHITREHTEDA